jgi:hypothetical protein
LAGALAPLSVFADVSDDPDPESLFFVSPFDELEDSVPAFPFDE